MSASSLVAGTPAAIPSLTNNQSATGGFVFQRTGTSNATAPAGTGVTLGLLPNGQNSTYFDIYATGGAGAEGLAQDTFSLWGYAPSLASPRNINQYLVTSTNATNSQFGGSTAGIISLNPVFLDSDRIGTVDATDEGGVKIVPVASIVASSKVVLIPIAISAAAATAGVVPPAAPVIVPSTGSGVRGTFTFNAQAGVGYQYLVF